MDSNQLDIINHKTKLMNLINNLINTQLVHEEIFINNEIKKESEYLSSLLNSKQIRLMNQNNNNINSNPFIFQQNIMMNIPQMHLNQIEQNNFNPENNKENNEPTINVRFIQENDHSKIFAIQCNPNEKISDVIEKYRQRADDYLEDNFIFNNTQLGNLSSTLSQIGIIDNSLIGVFRKGVIKG